MGVMRSSFSRSDFQAMLDAFGESCVVETSSATYDVQAVFSNADQEVAAGLGIVVGQPVAEFWFEDVPEIADGATVTADGEVFTVKTVMHNREAGMVSCGMRRQS